MRNIVQATKNVMDRPALQILCVTCAWEPGRTGIERAGAGVEARQAGAGVCSIVVAVFAAALSFRSRGRRTQHRRRRRLSIHFIKPNCEFPRGAFISEGSNDTFRIVALEFFFQKRRRFNRPRGGT